MGGGYYLYDTCGNDLLALGEDNRPIQDMEKARLDVQSAVVRLNADGTIASTTMLLVGSVDCLSPLVLCREMALFF